MSYEMLFSPYKIGSMELKNRVVMTAAEMSLGQINGKPTEKLMDYYVERAKGGAGLIITGTTRVNNGYAATTMNQLSMAKDSHIAPMREFAERIHKNGAKLCVQLHHGGRQGYPLSYLPLLIPMVNAVPKSADLIYKMAPMVKTLQNSPIMPRVAAPSKCEPSYSVDGLVRGMSHREVKKLIGDFVAAARRCQKAGVDAVELHAAHGYLIQQFLSPNTNHRTDEYGGSLENRMRFLLEIIAEIREKCGNYPILVRLCVDEMYDRIGKPNKGYGFDEGKEMAKRLEQAGIDAIDVTSANYDTFNYWLEPTTFAPGWRSYLAKEIKEIVSIPVIAANLIRSPRQAEEQLRAGVQDFVGTARSFLCDPHWVLKASQGREKEIKRCIGCLNCIQSLNVNSFIGKNGECAINPVIGMERAYNELAKDGAGKTAVVVGAGCAGLEAAEVLARRGFKVTVLEKEKRSGGQVNTAASCLLRDKLSWCIDDLMANVQALGAELRFETEATAELIEEMKPYAVIIATGGVPVRPRSIEGADLPNVFTAPEIIMDKEKLKNGSVAVIGSGITGLECSEILLEAGNKVTVFEMADEVAPGAYFQMVDDEMSRIGGKVEFKTGKRLVSIKPDCIVAEDVKTKEMQRFAADNVVLSLGVRPVNELAEKLKEVGTKVFTVGDAVKSGRIAEAIHSAFDAAMRV